MLFLLTATNTCYTVVIYTILFVGTYTAVHDLENSVYVFSSPLAKIRIPMIFVLIVRNNLAFLPFAGRRKGLMERGAEMVITSL